MIRIGLSMLVASGAVLAQAPAFEVASIKVARTPEPGPFFSLIPMTPGERMSVDGSRVDIRFFSLYTLIVKAYGLKQYELSGPEWMVSQRFDIAAKIPDGVSKGRVPEMLQALLAERFKLSVRRESKEMAVYALVVGKNGTKLRESPTKEATVNADASAPDTSDGRTSYTSQGDARLGEKGRDYSIAAGPFGPIRASIDQDGTRHYELSSVTMPGLAEILTAQAGRGRPVIDMTNLRGSYQFSWDVRARSPDFPDDPVAQVLDAVGKAGLRLEPSKAPVDVIVVDHLEKTPTEN
jgi:uncharacterized protein (TIGR03435 family)